MLRTGASAIPDLGPIDIGKARRTGQAVSPSEDSQGFPQAQFAPDLGAAANGNGASTSAEASAATSAATSGSGASTTTMSMDAAQSQVCGGQWEKNVMDCVVATLLLGRTSLVPLQSAHVVFGLCLPARAMD